MIWIAAVHLAPVLLLGLLLLGRSAGQTATPEMAAAHGGWPAPWPGGITGPYTNKNTSTPVRLWRPLHYG